jgi:hypothetical protein
MAKYNLPRGYVLDVLKASNHMVTRCNKVAKANNVPFTFPDAYTIPKVAKAKEDKKP